MKQLNENQHQKYNVEQMKAKVMHSVDCLVSKSGHAVLCVEDYCYSIGMAFQGKPDVIVSYPTELAGAMQVAVNELISTWNNEDVKIGTLDNVLASPVKVVRLDSIDLVCSGVVSVLNAYYDANKSKMKGQMELVQLILPDPNGFYPDDVENYDQNYKQKLYPTLGSGIPIHKSN